MYAIADCNNFFVSCERVFNPGLNGRPVVVLSNNDGCVIARSNEAKALGIKMGVPFFQIDALVKRHQVVVCSTNFPLYGDMSDRVMRVIASLTPEIEIYSIDEAFLPLEGIADLTAHCRTIVQAAQRTTGIPLSIGCAPTRTLAKIAGRFAKKYSGYGRVCLIDDETKRLKALQQTAIGDVWGIGRRYQALLTYHSVYTAYDLTLKSRSWVRKHLSVVGERTWTELQGMPSIVGEEPQAKKQLCTSRTFGVPIVSFVPLLESVAHFAALSARKLRQQQSVAHRITLFVSANRFEANYEKREWQVKLSVPTNDTAEVITQCRRGLLSIYKEGVSYKRAGVILSDIVPDAPVQQDLFDPMDRQRQRKIMSVMDRLALKYGNDILRVATEGKGYRPFVKQEYLSRRYSTNLREIIEVHIP